MVVLAVAVLLAGVAWPLVVCAGAHPKLKPKPKINPPTPRAFIVTPRAI